ncbi:SCO2521 family protein [Catellatospora sp. KI3]|uniref:SCO2521 family protein n=1 Tax=Catellatospora sp. KI3 TaxID=3041620 RepID=UPI0024831FEB|nr:SCO2521 family protein [Catellatospora sp. KI3]MDI1465187.1 SCO2521 family protein [Catellatospora sp. KI3]
MAEHLVTLGEVHTALLRNSVAVSATDTEALLDLVQGRRVRRAERPIAHAQSPERHIGVDCPLAASGPRVRGVGTVCTRATITGGHVAQASAYARVVRGEAGRRLPWSHYLAAPGTIETVGRADAARITDGVLRGEPGEALNLDAIGNRTLDQVQLGDRLDRRPAFRTAGTRLRWAAGPAGGTTGLSFSLDDPTTRTLRLPRSDADDRTTAEFCEDLALHDWLLTTLLTMVESRPAGSARADTVARIRPAIDFLLHLWMPGARTDPALQGLWRDVEHRPGFTRQWRVNVDRIRDQLALATIERLGR